MKNFRYILVLLLALVVFVLGAGTGVVHICSVYCKTQMCSLSSHSCMSCNSYSCCHDNSDNHESIGTEFSERCSCLNLSYNIDFFKLSQDDTSIAYMPVVMDVLDWFSYYIHQNIVDLFDVKAINAPPYDCYGRKLLAFNSTLII